MLELWINSQLVELKPGEEIILQKAVGRIGNFSDREGLFSNDFTIPLSSPNTSIIGFHNRNLSNDTFPWQKQDAFILQRGQEISRGFIQLVKTDQTAREATLSFFGDNTNWFALLGADSLRDLDLSEYDHDWTYANITASFPNTEGYIYPIVDPGRWETATAGSTVTEDYFPCMFQKTLIEKIFDRIGYKVAGSFLSEFTYANTIIPVQRLVNAAGANASVSGWTPLKYYQFEFVPPAGSGSSAQDTDITNTNDSSVISLANDEFIAPSTATFTVSASATINLIGWDVTDPNTGLSADVELFIDYLYNGAIQNSQSVFSTTQVNQTPSNSTFTYSHDETIAMTISDTVKTQLRLVWSGVPASTTDLFIDFNVVDYNLATPDLETDANLSQGDEIIMAYNLPDISLGDFIKEMIVRHALVVTSDNFTKTVFFTPANEVFGNIANAPDWSAKMNLSGQSDIDFVEVVQDYGQKTYFKYEEDGTDEDLKFYKFANEIQYGQGHIEIANGFLPAEEDFYVSKFAPTIQKLTFTGNTGQKVRLASIPRYDSDDNRVDPTPRILMLAGETGGWSTDFNGSGVLQIDGNTEITGLPYAYFSRSKIGAPSNFDDYTEGLAWDLPAIANPADTPLLERWYRGIKQIWNQSRYIEVEMRLFDHEYAALDFTQPVFIDTDNISGYFIIDEIENYDGRMASVKLIQIP